MNWSKKIPEESGYYWFRTYPEPAPQVVEVNIGFGTVSATGSDVHMRFGGGIELQPKVEGLFWPVKLEPPQ